MKAPLSRYPGMNPFVLDWLHGDERFLPRREKPFVPAPRPADLAQALDRTNRQWGIEAGDAIAQWARGETRTIVAGQQVDFAGGPLYTIAKIASVVRMKRELEREGKPATAMFWLATEDHDFDEVATLCLPSLLTKSQSSQRDLVCIRASRAADLRSVVGPLPVPESLIESLVSLLAIPRPTWLRAGITFRDSFAELIASLFGNEVILVDALLPELRLAGAPLFDAIEAHRQPIHHSLTKRGEELQAAGYAEQVTPNEEGEYTLLYELDDEGRRQAPTAQRQATRTSTSALTRPLLQDAVLRPDVFIGGPAEVAYYAQIAPLHELLGIEMPRIALRGHVLAAPKRVMRAMERYGIAPEDVFSTADAILSEREPAGVAQVREILDDGKRELLQRIEKIRELALPADHSLAGSIQRSIGHLDFHFNKLGERAIRGLVRKDRERHAALREIVSTLYPDRHVQDRIAGWVAYHHVYGASLVEQLLAVVEPDSDSFTIATLEGTA